MQEKTLVKLVFFISFFHSLIFFWRNGLLDLFVLFLVFLFIVWEKL